MGAEIVEILADLAGNVVTNHRRGDGDGVGDALVIGSAVTLHHQSVEAKENRAIMIVGVQVGLEQVERGLGQSEAGFRSKRRGESAAEKVGDEASSAFRRL